MQNQYRTIIRQDYSAGIWDNCNAKLQIRNDRRRGRLVYDEVVWHNNNGSLVRRTQYMTIDAARKLLRQYRQAVIAEMGGDFSGRTTTDILTDNWH